MRINYSPHNFIPAQDPVELVGTHSRIEHKANSEEWDKREGVRINCIPGTEREGPSDSHFGT